LLRSKGFVFGWRKNKQVASRASVRGAEHIVIAPEYDGRTVKAMHISAELEGTEVDLHKIDPVDLSELFYELGEITGGSGR
jgi:hypothetical protein